MSQSFATAVAAPHTTTSNSPGRIMAMVISSKCCAMARSCLGSTGVLPLSSVSARR